MVTYNFKFDVFEYVMIKAIETKGRISIIKVSGKNLFYDVEFWLEGSLKVLSFNEDEIEKLETIK